MHASRQQTARYGREGNYRQLSSSFSALGVEILRALGQYPSHPVASKFWVVDFAAVMDGCAKHAQADPRLDYVVQITEGLCVVV